MFEMFSCIKVDSNNVDEYIAFLKNRSKHFFEKARVPDEYDVVSFPLLFALGNIAKKYPRWLEAYAAIIESMSQPEHKIASAVVDDVRKMGVKVPAPYIRDVYALKSIMNAGMFDRFYGTLSIEQRFNGDPKFLKFFEKHGFSVIYEPRRPYFDDWISAAAIVTDTINSDSLAAFLRSVPANDEAVVYLTNWCNVPRSSGPTFNEIYASVYGTH